mgnify:CR=1 FL=1
MTSSEPVDGLAWADTWAPQTLGRGCVSGAPPGVTIVRRRHDNAPFRPKSLACKLKMRIVLI